MRIVNKYMGIHCTVYIINIIMMINEEEGKEVVKKYKGKEGYSVEGLEQRVTYVFKIMFLNYRVKKIVKTKFIHMIHSFFTDITCITS